MSWLSLLRVLRGKKLFLLCREKWLQFVDIEYVYSPRWATVLFHRCSTLRRGDFWVIFLISLSCQWFKTWCSLHPCSAVCNDITVFRPWEKLANVCVKLTVMFLLQKSTLIILSFFPSHGPWNLNILTKTQEINFADVLIGAYF
jgi:hypothetical protein